MKEDIKEQLMARADQEYGTFSKSLIPDCKPLIGVRLPQLRTMAKSLVQSHPKDWTALLVGEDHYFEEVMLRGMIMGYGCSRNRDIKQALKMLDAFVPLVDNWSVCDSCCVSFTVFGQYPEQTLQHIERYLHSNLEFEVRVGLIILLNHFLKTDAQGKKLIRRSSVEMRDLSGWADEPAGAYTEIVLRELDRPFTQGYYAQMAAAWLTAECFVTFPKHTYAFLEKNQMDDVTYNKALQKICESRTPDRTVKAQIHSMKRKKVGNP